MWENSRILDWKVEPYIGLGIKLEKVVLYHLSSFERYKNINASKNYRYFRLPENIETVVESIGMLETDSDQYTL